MTSFEDLYNTYFKRVYAYIFSRVRNHATAEDLCAAAWKNAYEHWASFDEQKGEFTQWIFTIARNQTNMYWRLYWVKKRIFANGGIRPCICGRLPFKKSGTGYLPARPDKCLRQVIRTGTGYFSAEILFRPKQPANRASIPIKRI